MHILVVYHSLGGKGRKRDPGCSLECKYLNSDDYKDLLWTTLSEFPGKFLNYNSVNISFLSNVWQAKKKMWWTYWSMHHRPAGDPVGNWSLRKEEDYGTVFLCLLPLHCAALRLCGKVRKHIHYGHFSRALEPLLISNVNIHLHLHVMENQTSISF